MEYVVMGTAGHVDHGKTSLVKALTGIDCDRLAEEKRREITIDIGFAHLRLGDGRMVSIVDVPGHERFVKNMLAGATGIDFVLLTVAADDGVMPQTLEHLDICHTLGVRGGVIAVTKTDLVEPEIAEIAAEEARGAVRGAFLENARIVMVSAETGQGIPELMDAIRAAAIEAKPRDSSGPVRLPIDRVFSIKGSGTVVTGTLVSGSISVGDELEMLPSARRVRVRRLQSHGKDVKSTGPGLRLAVNVPDLETLNITRGDVLAAPGSLAATRALDVRVNVLPRAAKPLKNRARVRLHSGTQEVIGRISFLDGAPDLPPGRETYARLRLESPVVCVRRDLFVLRLFSPVTTIGGGVVIDTAPGNPGAKAKKPAEIIERLKLIDTGGEYDLVERTVAESALVPISPAQTAKTLGIQRERAVEIMHSLAADGVLMNFGNDNMIAGAVFERLKSEIIIRLKEYFDSEPRRPWVSPAEIRTKFFGRANTKVFDSAVKSLLDSGHAVSSASAAGIRARAGSDEILAEEERIRNEILRIFSESRFNPPTAEELPSFIKSKLLSLPEIFKVVLETGQVVKLSPNAFLKKELLDEAEAMIVAKIKETGGITPAQVRDLLGASRKFVIPILEGLDARGVTVRIEERRILK